MPNNELERLIDGDQFVCSIAKPDGLLFVGGLANSYEPEYPADVDISAVMSEAELTRLVGHFNNAIQSYWPCTACYAFGCLAAPFTLGISLCVPNYCISEAEKAGLRCLEQFCLKPTFYDRAVKFRLVKSWTCTSYIEMTCPVALLSQANPIQSEDGGPVTHRAVGGASQTSDVVIIPPGGSGGRRPLNRPLRSVE